MALSPRLEVRQSQSLTLTPQLMQSIRLLQLSHLELNAFVDTELLRNPLLEREDGTEAVETPEPVAEVTAYDDAVVRARLAQAFGRLIRRERDRGTFVILSAAMPSRLLSAFPAGVPIRRVPLGEAIAYVAAAATVSPATTAEAVQCERSTF